MKSSRDKAMEVLVSRMSSYVIGTIEVDVRE